MPPSPETYADQKAESSQDTDVNAAISPSGHKSQVYVRAGEAPLVAGRRAYFKYADLGVTGATDGHMRAQVISGENGMAKPTGWHYHVCEVQFLFGLVGWIDLAFEDGTTARLEAGDSVLIPGGLVHNETATSREFQVMEISLPANMGTIPCAAPAGFDA